MLFLCIFTAQAGQVSLAWGASSGANGYRVYQVQTGETMVNLTTPHVTDSSPVVADVAATTATINNLVDGKTYYFAVKAYNGTKLSGFSNEAGKTIASTVAVPSANFTMSPTTGTVSQPVNFTDTSTGTVTSWAWDFGDGTPASTARNPAHTYTTARTYTVTLTASNSAGTSPAATKTITVNHPKATAPIPGLTYTMNPATGQVPVAVTFKGTWTGNATKWNFSGTSPFVGSTGTTQPATAIQTYHTPGTYTVTFSVTGAGGTSKPVSQTISVTTTAPTANFSASSTTVTTSQAVQFTDTSTPTGAISAWSWNFGDSNSGTLNTSTAQSPSHTYARAGTYTVSLTATNSAGKDDEIKTGYITVSTSTAGSGLVAAYNFEEASGATVVDASGRGNHGTLSCNKADNSSCTAATRITSGKFGKALSFDGVDDWVTVNDSASLDLTTGMTVEAWVYPTSAPSSWGTIIRKETADDAAYALVSAGTNDLPEAYVPSIGSAVTGAMILPANTWAHLATTYNGSTLVFYINGNEVNRAATSGNIPVSNGSLMMGGSSVWGNYFNGRIDEIRIYNRALSVPEIKTDMNTAVATSSPPKRLLGYQALGAVAGSLAQGMAAAFQTTYAVTGRVTSLSVYVDTGSASTNLVAGLYKDNNGHPGARLATGTLSSPKAGSWNTVLLPATAITAGTKYWVAILSPNGVLTFRDKVGTVAQPSETSMSTILTTLPSTWVTGTVSGNGPLSGYGAGYR